VTLDEFRSAHPDFGFVAYAAFEPGAIVEVIRGGAVLEQVRADSFDAAVEDAVNVARLVIARELAEIEDRRREAEALFGPPATTSIFD